MAIVYSYPKVTSPLATDVLVITDTTVTAGKRKNKTKSIAMSDVATYVINSKSGITGTGTINKFPIFTAATVIGDSIITQAALGQGITVGGNLEVTNDTDLQGSLLADSLEVTNDSIFIGSARFNGTIKDTSGGVGTNGQVLTSTGTGVAWATDAGGSVTGTGTTNYIAKWDTSSSIQDSIIFDNGTNVGVGTATPSAKLHVNGSEFLVTQGNETGLDINNDTYIYKIGDISGGENQSYMQIDSAASKAFFLNSNVGIGTTSPSAKLQVLSSGDTVVKITSADGNAAFLDLGDASDTDGGRIVYDSGSNLALYTASSERMRIKNNGNVGIGTTNPGYKLHVKKASSDASITIEGNTNAGALFSSRLNFSNKDISGNDIDFTIGLKKSNDFVFLGNAAANELIRIEGDTGNVGIGTNSPASKLHVAADIRTDTRISFTGTGFITSNATNLELETVSNKDIILNPQGTGNVGIGTTSPTEKLDIYSNSDAVIRLESAGGGVGSLDVGTDFTINNRINTNLIFKTSNTEKMRITNSGNVGIGTTSPEGELHVKGANPEFILEDTTNPNKNKIQNTDGNMKYHADYEGTQGNSRHTFFIDGSEKLRIDTDGKVGIGTTNPAYALDIVSSQTNVLRLTSTGSTSGVLIKDSNTTDTVAVQAQGNNLQFRVDNGRIDFKTNTGGSGITRMRVTDDGDVGIGTTTPQSKLEVDGGDIEVDDSANGLILRSPNGTRYRIQVDNSGNLTTTAV